MTKIFFGVDVWFQPPHDNEQHKVAYNSIADATAKIWENTPLPDSVRAEHQLERTKFLDAVEFLIENPVPSFSYKKFESVSDWYDQIDLSDYPKLHLRFSPFSPCTLNFEGDYNGEDDVDWHGEFYLEVKEKRDFQIFDSGNAMDNEPRFATDLIYKHQLNSGGTVDLRVSPFVESASGMTPKQQEVFDELCRTYDLHREDDQVMQLWSFNSRALAFVGSSLWSALPGLRFEPMYPGYN